MKLHNLALVTLALLAVVLAAPLATHSVSGSDVGRSLPIDRLLALEERSERLETAVTKLNGKMEMVIASVERIETDADRGRTIRIDPDPAVGVSDVAALVNPLAKDVDRLRAEVAKLRQGVGNGTQAEQAESRGRQAGSDSKGMNTSQSLSVGSGSARLSDGGPAAESETPEPTSYWLTESSGVRHNASCRWFEASNGRPANSDEGRACERCGG